jgi:acyl-CoA thioester hydrolase
MHVRIYYEDTDCGGIVYHANYLKYFERARTEYLEVRGLSVSKLLADGTQFYVVRAEMDFRSPARYGDTLIVETSLGECRKASMAFTYVVRERESRRVVVEGYTTLATVDLEGNVKRLPDGLIEKLKAPPSRPGVGKRHG